MNREIYHEGFLVKSPPNKFWRARWRRRWFTLKQGELPGQYFLEYYTDRNCRKMKGVIDLDQCEQVDAGLRMNNAKHKLPFMFDVKTPRRTYYLAADTEEELKGWVNCICQVCGLQDLSRQGDDRHYFNIGPNCPLSNASVVAPKNTRVEYNVYCVQQVNDSSCVTETTDLNNSTEQSNNLRSIDNQLDNLSMHNTYQNDDFLMRNSVYSNRETLVCDAKLGQTTNDVHQQNGNFSNAFHQRTLSSASSASAPQRPTTSSTIKKIPENLKLSENINDFDDNSKPSPSLSTCSGPYIPISECYSGSPALPPNNLLNSLDPRFYDTPKNHNINIGLNLTDEQPYSPKRNNCPTSIIPRLTSGQSSPTDSESVFTDDDCSQTDSLGTIERRTARPSESSVENDAAWTYVQRFSRVPNDNSVKNGDEESENPPPRPPKRLSALVLDETEKSKENQTSDTENASPAIGPKESTSYVEERYDIPRSLRLPYHLNNNNPGNCSYASPDLITSADVIAQSTPNLVVEGHTVKTNFYTNAAPRNVEGSVFRYDFIEQGDAPAVNRNLKPKTKENGKNDDGIPSTEQLITPTLLNDSISSGNRTPTSIPNVSGSSTSSTPLKVIPPPNVDRKLKPSTPKLDTNSMRRRPNTKTIKLSQGDSDDDDTGSLHSFKQVASPNHIGTSKSEDKLQYLDLDHSANLDASMSSLNISIQPEAISSGTLTKSTTSIASSSVGVSSGTGTLKKCYENSNGTVYKTVDFLKTEAFKRTRQDVEMIRANNRLKE